MALIRVISQVGKDGRIMLPANVRQAAGLRAGCWMELRGSGSSRKKNVLITARDAVRTRPVKPPRRVT